MNPPIVKPVTLGKKPANNLKILFLKHGTDFDWWIHILHKSHPLMPWSL